MNQTLDILKTELPKALWETTQMVTISTLIAIIFGGLIGLLLFFLSNPLFVSNKFIHLTVGFIVNAIRSLPFLILMVVLIPLSVLIVGDPYTPAGATVSLTIAAIPFFARIAEGAFSEIDNGVLEAAIASGADLRLIFTDVLLPESLPSLIRGIVLTLISVLGYSAMVGTIGAGGVGNVAIQYGYNRYEIGVLIAIIIILILLVQIIQWFGDKLAQIASK